MTSTDSRGNRRGTATIAVALAAGLIGSGVLVWQSSYAAFSSTTTNPTSSFSAGSVTLSDNDSGTAVFSVTNLKPGDSGRGCIAVAYGGSLTPAAAIQVYATAGATNTLALANNLYFSIEQASSSSAGTAPIATGSFSANGTAGGACDILTGLTPIYGGVTAATSGNPTAAKALSDFQALTAYSAGATTSVASFTPAAQTAPAVEYRVFRFRYMLSATAPDSVQGGTANVSVNWEVRSS